MTTDTPGVKPSQIFEVLDDVSAARLLPGGVFDLVKKMKPCLLTGQKRSETLGKLFSHELAVDDLEKRKILLESIPANKVAEFEHRINVNVTELLVDCALSYQVRRAVLGFFGYAMLPSKRTEEVNESESVAPSRGLFPHQKRTASAVENFLYRDRGRAMLHLPTGVGKTRIAMSIVASHLRRCEPGVVLWLAATRELLEQAAIEFEETWRSVGDHAVDCFKYWGRYNSFIEEIRDGIVIAGLSKLHSFGRDREKLWKFGDKVSMVVFDEAHQAVANTYKALIDTIVTRNPNTVLLGLSATPGRTWGDPEADEAVAELFYRNKVMLEIDAQNPIRHLTDEGYLSEVNFSLLNVTPGLELTSSDLIELSNSLDISESIAQRLGSDEQRNLRIIERLLSLVERHKRVLVFCPSVDNAILINSVCRALGVDSYVVTGQTDSVLREAIIHKFKAPGGTKKVLFNYGVLTTGFDAPAASAALIARPTKSLVLYSQMVGRVIRGPKAGGTNSCEVVTVVDTNLPGFRNVTEAYMNWEDVWNIVE